MRCSNVKESSRKKAQSKDSYGWRNGLESEHVAVMTVMHWRPKILL
jgi:hypothetical protein